MYKNYIIKNLDVLNKMNDLESVYDKVVDLLVECLKNNHKILFAGNGGSAADSMHIATELVSRFKLERNPFFALALSSNQSAITAIGNDYSFDEIFSKQVQAYGTKNDILISISTSGTSKNIVKAIASASNQGIKTILVTGNSNAKADVLVCIPSTETSVIQNMYLIFLHVVCETVERILANENSN